MATLEELEELRDRLLNQIVPLRQRLLRQKRAYSTAEAQALPG